MVVIKQHSSACNSQPLQPLASTSESANNLYSFVRRNKYKVSKTPERPLCIELHAITLSLAIGIIFRFTYYSSVIHDESFKKRFTEMAAISLGVATLTFLIGFGIRKLIGIEV